MYRFVLPSTLHIDDWSTDKVSFELHWDGKYRKEFDEKLNGKIEIVDWKLRFRKERTSLKLSKQCIGATFCNDFQATVAYKI